MPHGFPFFRPRHLSRHPVLQNVGPRPYFNSMGLAFGMVRPHATWDRVAAKMSEFTRQRCNVRGLNRVEEKLNYILLSSA